MPDLTKTPPRRRLTRARVAAVLTLLTAVLASALALLAGGAPSTVTVHTTDAIGLPAPVVAPKSSIEDAKEGLDDHAGSNEVKPPGVTDEQWQDGIEQDERFAKKDKLPTTFPLAAPQQYGCTTRIVVNYSSRNGVKPRLFVIHYTVSPNRPGWVDVWGIVGLFNTPSFRASSNYVIDDAGNCAYIVAEVNKSWTQAGFNSAAISVEVIATGKEGRLAAAAGIAKLGRVVSDATKRWGIPLQTGKVSGCTVVRPGVLDHKALGACGGGHVDVSPYSVAPVLAAAKKVRAGSNSRARERAAVCGKLQFHRSHPHPWGAKRVARVNELKDTAKRIGLGESACRA